MNLRDVLLRVYDILGDDIDSPRWYPRADVVSLVNEACLQFRTKVEDGWYEKDVPVTANTLAYDYPGGHVKAKRLAYADSALLPRGSVNALDGEDGYWRSWSASEPWYWTGDGVLPNQYQIIPAPVSSSVQYYSWNAEYGTVVGVEGYAGTSPFATDPANPTHIDPENGIVLTLNDTIQDPDFGSEYGVLVFVRSGSSDFVTIWGVKEPSPLAADSDDIGVKQAFAYGIPYYVLWNLYDQGGDRHNGVLAAFYRDLWDGLVAQATALAENPLPRQIHVIGSGQRVDPIPQFSNTITTGGGPITVRWPRGA